MAYEFDNIESKIGQAGAELTNGDHLVSEAYTGMAAMKGRQLNGGQASESVDRTFGQLTLTGTDQDIHRSRTGGRQDQPLPSPLDLSPEAEARRREAAARRAQEWLQRFGDRRGMQFPH